jgi:tellurite methyltransferase
MAKINDEHINITEPSRFLVDNVELLPRGLVLDLAMGGGRNAVYLAESGFEVEGVDVSQEAVESAQRLAARQNVKINTHVADLEKGYKISREGFDVIICFNYLQRSLMQDIKDGVRRGGIVIYETYIVDQARYGKPKNPDHLLKHNELLEIFREFRCLRYREGIFRGPRNFKAIASIVAQKLQ